MKTITFSSGEVIFREGDLQLTMYDILKGGVGIYLDYGTPQEKQLTVLREHQLLGEMGLVEACPRSATAVALEDRTTLREITEEEYTAFFRSEPERLLALLKQMSARIRDNTEKYHEACRALAESQEAEKAGRKKSEALDRQMESISREAKKQKPGQSVTRSSFYDYVQEDLEAYEGKREVVRASLFERLVVRRIAPEDMHVNPDDEFADPEIGPSDRIINEYMHELVRLYRDKESIYPSPIVVFKLASEGYMILNGHHRWAAAVRSGWGKLRAVIMNPPK